MRIKSSSSASPLQSPRLARARVNMRCNRSRRQESSASVWCHSTKSIESRVLYDATQASCAVSDSSLAGAGHMTLHKGGSFCINMTVTGRCWASPA